MIPGTSAWVSTAWTPGSERAAAVSIAPIRARGTVARSVAPHSIASTDRSEEYANSPVTLGTPSARGTLSPIPPRTVTAGALTTAHR